MDHLRALRDVSEIDNGASPARWCTRWSPTASVYFGSNADAGNTDETVKFPSALALLWRWSGDNGFRDELYRFARRGMRTVWRAAGRATATAGPRAWATSSARAWATRSST